VLVEFLGPVPESAGLGIVLLEGLEQCIDGVAEHEASAATIVDGLERLLGDLLGQKADLREEPEPEPVLGEGEVGSDRSRFSSAAHLISWADLCPRSDESAGKRGSTRLSKGFPWLKTTLVQAAWAAVRTNGSYLRAQFLRLKTRRGPKKAILAVAVSMLTAAYHMLRSGVPYRDLTETYFARLDHNKLTKRPIRRLRGLSFDVTAVPDPHREVSPCPLLSSC